MSRLRTELIPKEHFGIFIAKADEFRETMDAAWNAGNFNAAASSAAHCVTSACDALVAHHLGVRCKGQDHREMVALLPQLPFTVPREHARQILSVLDLKAVAEYEDRDVTPQEAEGVVKQATRLLQWVVEHLPPPARRR